MNGDTQVYELPNIEELIRKEHEEWLDGFFDREETIDD